MRKRWRKFVSNSYFSVGAVSRTYGPGIHPKPCPSSQQKTSQLVLSGPQMDDTMHYKIEGLYMLGFRGLLLLFEASTPGHVKYVPMDAGPIVA